MARTMTDWILTQGGSGPVPDRWNQYLGGLGYTTGTFNDKMNKRMAALGYTGTYVDKLKQWKDVHLS